MVSLISTSIKTKAISKSSLPKKTAKPKKMINLYWMALNKTKSRTSIQISPFRRKSMQKLKMRTNLVLPRPNLSLQLTTNIKTTQIRLKLILKRERLLRISRSQLLILLRKQSLLKNGSREAQRTSFLNPQELLQQFSIVQKLDTFPLSEQSHIFHL
jgi:hypothetical protein